MIQLETITLDTSNLGGEIGGTSNVIAGQDSILTYQGTTEQPHQPLTRGETTFFQDFGPMLIFGAPLVVYGIYLGFKRLCGNLNYLKDSWEF